MPKSYSKYHELFLGGGALFFAIKPKCSCLSDTNVRLISTYNVVKNYPYELIEKLKEFANKHSKEYYLNIRNQSYNIAQHIEKNIEILSASIFIYLNKTCYNGLYRVNKNGKFNVPIGRYSNPKIVDEENLIAVSRILQNTTIKKSDFMEIDIIRSSFYYLDPPYHNTYTGYSSDGFIEKDHVRLAEYCHEIDKRGAFFMLSNSDTELMMRLYSRYNIENIESNRCISCKSNQRKKENELIIRNY